MSASILYSGSWSGGWVRCSVFSDNLMKGEQGTQDSDPGLADFRDNDGSAGYGCSPADVADGFLDKIKIINAVHC